jgi:hypothetical protein
MKKSISVNMFYGFVISLSICSFAFLNLKATPAVSSVPVVQSVSNNEDDQDPLHFHCPMSSYSRISSRPLFI